MPSRAVTVVVLEGAGVTVLGLQLEVIRTGLNRDTYTVPRTVRVLVRVVVATAPYGRGSTV